MALVSNLQEFFLQKINNFFPTFTKFIVGQKILKSPYQTNSGNLSTYKQFHGLIKKSFPFSEIPYRILIFIKIHTYLKETSMKLIYLFSRFLF